MDKFSLLYYVLETDVDLERSVTLIRDENILEIEPSTFCNEEVFEVSVKDCSYRKVYCYAILPSLSLEVALDEIKKFMKTSDRGDKNEL